MSKLVLTGATGFLGTALIDALERNGELGGTIALCRKPAPALSARGVDVRVGALDDARFLAEALPAGARVVHLAGKVEFKPEKSQTMYDLHVEGTRTLARAALAADCERFVLMSSSGTTAVSKVAKPLDESAPYPLAIISRWPYYLSKLMQERLVLDLSTREGLPAIVLNPSLLLGPGDERGGSTAVVADFLGGRYPVAPPGGIGVVDVRDVAEAVRGALARGRVGERYLLGGWNGSFADFFLRLEAVAGINAPALTAPRPLGGLAARAVAAVAGYKNQARAAAFSAEKLEMASHYWYVDWQKASRELGFAPRALEATLRDTVASLRETDR